MEEVTTIGLDIAKQIFHAHGADTHRWVAPVGMIRRILAQRRLVAALASDENGGFPALARFVNGVGQEPREAARQAKGTVNMSGSSVQRTIIAISAALILSGVTVGATVSPAQAGTIQASEVARG